MACKYNNNFKSKKKKGFVKLIKEQMNIQPEYFKNQNLK